MDIDLNGYSEAELVDLNHRIVERIRVLRQGRYRESLAKFNVGDRVSFNPDCGHEVLGTVVRINTKSVTVVSTDGTSWRVAPGLLNKAFDEVVGQPPTGDAIVRAQGSLIDLAAVRQQHDRGKA
jgi:hypothetical protein